MNLRMRANPIRIVKRFSNTIVRLATAEYSTIHQPFFGYGFFRRAYLLACQMGLVNFNWEATKVQIDDYVAVDPVSITKPQTMVEEGHVGGYLHEGARGTWNPMLWSCLIDLLDVRSVLDIGCGRGSAVAFFAQRVPVVVGTEGSVKAVETSLIPDRIVLHDYTRGLSPVSSTFDLGWCCEVVEHIEERYVLNLIADFRKCRFLAMTYATPGQGGYHHVNEQFGIYWIELLSRYGFEFCKPETTIFRHVALLDEIRNRHYNHFAHKGLFFVDAELATAKTKRS